MLRMRQCYRYNQKQMISVLQKRWMSKATPNGNESTGAYPKLGDFTKSLIGGERDGLTRFPSFSSAPGLLRATDYFGTVIFAMSGSITAGMCGLDCLGATIVGTITAIGGGTFRDAIILHKQPFWIEEYEYLLMAAGASLLTFGLWKEMPSDNIVKDKDGGEGPFMWWGDALGVGAFAVIGAQNGIRMCVHPVIAATCGMVTATFGGLTRDVLCGLPADKQGHGRILHSKSDLYASTAFAGAVSYLSVRALGAPVYARIGAGVATSMSLRYAAKTYNLGLPTWEKPNFSKESVTP